MHSNDEVHEGAEEGEDSACCAGEHNVLGHAGCLNTAGSHTPLTLNGKHGSSDAGGLARLYSCSLKRK